LNRHVFCLFNPTWYQDNKFGLWLEFWDLEEDRWFLETGFEASLKGSRDAALYRSSGRVLLFRLTPVERLWNTTLFRGECMKETYQPPKLEEHQFAVVTGVSLPIGNGLTPPTDFLETTQDFLEMGEQ
jgi:hypothetical protein